MGGAGEGHQGPGHGAAPAERGCQQRPDVRALWQVQSQPPGTRYPQELLEEAAAQTDTALWVLGRRSGGEECDRHLENDFTLSPEEEALLEALCAHFEKVAVVLNTNGLVDLSWVEPHPQVKALLFLGVPGDEGPAAMANLLTGKVNPSGKLSVTIAQKGEDYPAWKDFSWDKDHPENILTYGDYGLEAPASAQAFDKRPVTVYREGIYLGYRYFDSFGVKPLYPFGFGLSYTTFSLRARRGGKGRFRPAGARPGGEHRQLPRQRGGSAVLVRLRHPAGAPLPGAESLCQDPAAGPRRRGNPHPGRALAGAGKLCGRVAALGSSRRAPTWCGWGIPPRPPRWWAPSRYRRTLWCPRARALWPWTPRPRRRVDWLTRQPAPVPELPADCVVLSLAAGEVEARPVPAVPVVDCSALSDEELACLCVGFGPGLPFPDLQETELPSTLAGEDGRPLTENDHPTGHNGYVSPAIPGKGIHSVFYKDGPAGIGQTGWPGEMLLACSFDRDVLRAMGDAIGRECEVGKVDVWLAPAINLHRHPLGGRNFEYYSEDPVLAGAMAAAVLQGLQENHNVLGCAKHFAANEQETYRRGSAKVKNGLPAFDAVDSILSQRALRELYLKPFQVAVEEGGLHCLMTSFNKVTAPSPGAARTCAPTSSGRSGGSTGPWSPTGATWTL